MKNIIIKNFETINAQVMKLPNGSKFNVREVIPSLEINKCYANFIEVEPGNSAYSYHYHENQEEIFYVVSGEACVKTPDGEKHLTKGDIIAFPANENGAHIISNPSKTEKLVYIDFGAGAKPDVVHFVGTGAGWIINDNGIKNFKE